MCNFAGETITAYARFYEAQWYAWRNLVLDLMLSPEDRDPPTSDTAPRS